MEIINTCPYNPISHTKGNGSREQWPCEFYRNDLAFLKFLKALKLKDHQSSFLMTDGHSQKKRILKDWLTLLSEGYFLLLFQYDIYC